MALALAAPVAPASAKSSRSVEAPAAVLRGDPLVAKQWQLGPRGANASAAWTSQRGAGVVVAVLDSGIDSRHPDLRGALWTNRGEIGGNGIDDDRNGFVDDVHGVDFVDGDSDPTDVAGHGTAVAGVIAATAGNRRGIVGLAPRARIMPVRVMTGRPQVPGSTADVAAGIRYATVNGARIINLSLNGPKDTPEINDALEFARQHGVLAVVSGGNAGKDTTAVTARSWPACSVAPNVVTVASHGARAGLSPFSNRGPCIDLAAPGEEILSTALHSHYRRVAGTSVAAPHVSAAAALLVSNDPTLSADRLRELLVKSARPAAGASRLDVSASLARVERPVPRSL